MAIIRKPTTPTAESFIQAAQPTRDPLHPITLRIDPELLARVDRAAQRRGITRSALIKLTLCMMLEQEP